MFFYLFTYFFFFLKYRNKCYVFLFQGHNFINYNGFKNVLGDTCGLVSEVPEDACMAVNFFFQISYNFSDRSMVSICFSQLPVGK